MADSRCYQIARFGVFELDAAAGELRRSGRLVALTGQPFRVLTLLVERSGEVVTRDELHKEIWGADTHVDFNAGLSTCINQIRSALGDRAGASRFLETLPRRGYRFIAPVEWITPASEVESTTPVSAVESTTRVARVAVPRFRTLAAVMGLLALIFVFVHALASKPAATSIQLVVLPVDIDSTRADLGPVSLSLTDALIGSLVREGGERARVASPIAIQHLRGKPMTLKDISDIGAEYFVHVTLRSAGGPVLVHSKLAHISGWILWTSDRVMSLQDLENSQIELAAELARTVALEILPSAGVGQRRSASPSALPEYAQARSDLDAGRNQKALAQFERAHQLDPQHPGSLAGLAHALVENAWDGTLDRQKACERAEALANRALALDPENPRARLALGAVAWLRDGGRDQADRLFAQALAIDGSFRPPLEWRARLEAELMVAPN